MQVPARLRFLHEPANHRVIAVGSRDHLPDQKILYGIPFLVLGRPLPGDYEGASWREANLEDIFDWQDGYPLPTGRIDNSDATIIGYPILDRRPSILPFGARPCEEATAR